MIELYFIRTDERWGVWVNIKMDFVSDWQDIIIGDMTAQGLRFSNSESKESLVIKYFTHLRKKGGQVSRPRRVHWSREFVCPLEQLKGLKKLVDVLEKGKDIYPYLSTRIDDISFNDGMFNDWGVLHLHLGDGPYKKDNRFMDRTGPLLFLYLMTDDAYLINIYEHRDWTKKSVLQTVQYNWPELLYPLEGVIKLSHQYTEKEHADLRKAGISATAQELRDINGDTIVVLPRGLGITTSGDAIQDVRCYQENVDKLHKIEEDVRGKLQEVFKGNGNVPDPLLLKLIHEDDKWRVVEQNTGIRFDLF